MKTGYVASLIDTLKTNGSKFHGPERNANWISYLRQSVKFRLPENAELITSAMDVSDSFLDFIKLPFPVTAMEYDLSLPAKDTGKVEATRCVTLAVNASLAVAPTRKDAWEKLGEDGGFLLKSFCFYPPAGWVPSFGEILIPHRQSAIMHLRPKGYNKIVMIPLVSAETTLGQLAIKQVGIKEAERILASDMYVDCNAVINVALCGLCDNVAQEIIEPSRVSNKMRREKRKEPFDTYRVLVLDQRAKSDKAEGESTKGVRLHLRRGHIRRLPSGRLTWVKNTVVGDAELGIARKDYHLRRRSA